MRWLGHFTNPVPQRSWAEAGLTHRWDNGAGLMSLLPWKSPEDVIREALVALPQPGQRHTRLHGHPQYFRHWRLTRGCPFAAAPGARSGCPAWELQPGLLPALGLQLGLSSPRFPLAVRDCSCTPANTSLTSCDGPGTCCLPASSWRGEASGDCREGGLTPHPWQGTTARGYRKAASARSLHLSFVPIPSTPLPWRLPVSPSHVGTAWGSTDGHHQHAAGLRCRPM